MSVNLSEAFNPLSNILSRQAASIVQTLSPNARGIAGYKVRASVASNGP